MTKNEDSPIRFSEVSSSTTRAAAQVLRPVCYIINDAVSHRPMAWPMGDPSHTNR
jgi:hypothetical protein